MRVLEVGSGFTYVFRCPDCGSKLEAERKDIEIYMLDCISPLRVKFICPICDCEKCISFDSMTINRK